MDQQVDILMMVPVNPEERLNMHVDYKPGPHMRHVPCEKCGHLCWGGPRQLAMKSLHPEMPLWCVVCATEAMIEAGQDPTQTPVRNLGGP